MTSVAAPSHVPHGSGGEKPLVGGTAASADQPVPTMGGVTGFSGNRRVPTPVNEPVRSYAPGSPEREELQNRLRQMESERLSIPLVIAVSRACSDARSGEPGA